MLKKLELIETIFIDELGSHIILRIEELNNSYGHECWKIRTNKGSYLLKIAIRNEEIDYFRNEVYAQRLVGESGIKVQGIIVSKETPNPLKKHFYIQEWLPGEDAETVINSFDCLEKENFAYDFGKGLAGLHNIQGETFSDDIIGNKKYNSWRELVSQRLDKLIFENKEVNVLDDKTLSTIEKRCRSLIQLLPEEIKPGFTHRDLYLSNVLVQNNKFHCIIDYEHARFYDPLWDFVKIEAWIFRKHPDIRKYFYQGYQSVIPWKEEYIHRIRLYEGVEFLAAFPYFGDKYPNENMLDTFKFEIKDWLDNKTVAYEDDF